MVSDITKIEQLASIGAELPSGLTSPDQWLFLLLRALYRSYNDGYITVIQARKEKAQIIKSYEVSVKTLEMYRDGQERFQRIRTFQSDIEKSGCRLCRMVVKIFDGRK